MIVASHLVPAVTLLVDLSLNKIRIPFRLFGLHMLITGLYIAYTRLS